MFADALDMTLTLSISGEAFQVPGANIKVVRARIHPYGFAARLEFWVSAETGPDKLYPKFMKTDLITVQLSVQPHFRPEDAKIEPLTLQGIVQEKALLKELTIENIHLKRDPVLYRYYRVDVADPAFVLWRQHFPCDLLVNGCVKDLIEANKTSEISLSCDWGTLGETFAINTLSPRWRIKGVSFYDFLMWYCAAYNGVFTYDAAKNSYSLAGQKAWLDVSAAMSGLEVESYRIDFAPAARFNDRLLNAYSEAPKKKETKRDAAADGVLQDRLVREPITTDYEKAFNLESGKQKTRGHGVFLTHKRFPLLTYRPGELVTFTGGLWSDKIFLAGHVYRVRDIFLRARAVDDRPDADHNMPYTRYNMDLYSQLELKSEKALNLPRFKAPVYPIYVEGKVVSEQGGAEEETYQIYKHPQSGLDQYRVKIPAFGDKEIVAPFEPLFEPGHYYFPAYKGERVLVALDFHRAWIVGFVDWRPDGRLPMDTQGNHLLMGKGIGNNTSIRHVYVDNKPQLNVKRTSKKDTQILHLHQGRIVVQTKEES